MSDNDDHYEAIARGWVSTNKKPKRPHCTIKRLPGGCGCGYKAEVGVVIYAKMIVTEVHDDYVMTEDGVAIEHGRYMFSGDPRGRAP